MNEEYWQVAGIPLRLKWSARRKTIGLKVAGGQVSVSAPRRTSKLEIEGFVRAKATWVAKHLAAQQNCQAERSFETKPSTPYLGAELAIEFRPNESDAPYLCGSTLVLSGVDRRDTADIKQLLACWYATQALEYLAPKVNEYAEMMQVSPNGLKIRHYKSRWGSCNYRGELQFNWLIMLASPDVVDYVVVHELAHLKYFDHSRAFWRVVEDVLPSYKTQKDYLRRHGHELKL